MLRAKKKKIMRNDDRLFKFTIILGEKKNNINT